MHNLMTFFKSLQLGRILAATVASVLLFLGTACSPAQAKLADGAPQPGQAQSYKGGMNNFKDTTRDTTAADAKAKALRDRVETNIRQKRIDSVDQYVDNYQNGAPIQERTRKLGENIGQGAENAAEDAKNLSKEFSRNTQQSLDRGSKDFSSKVKNGAEGVKDNITGARDRLSDNGDRTVQGAANAIKDKVDETAAKVRRAADNLVD